mgnify:CR=1 FL=1
MTKKKNEKNKNLNIKSLFAYIKNYASNCRYSFNSMLSV